MRTFAAVCVFALAGCGGGTPKPVTEEVKSLDKIQGKWHVLQIVGPDGKGFEAQEVVIEIKDNIAFQGNSQLRLEFVPDTNVLKLFAKTDAGDKLVGEVTVTLTIEKPIQMLWADKNNSVQETLLEKVE